MTSRLAIAVIGAGPMGLMCALELLKRGHSVDLYEHDDRIGGMSASFDFDGLEIERYYHFICKTDYPLFELLNELGLSDRLRWADTRMGFYYNGRLNDWGTPQALLRFDGLDWISKIRYALHVMYTKNIKDWRRLDRVNAVDWLKRWLGHRGYDVLWNSLFQLKFHGYTNSLSAAWIGTRIKRVALSRRNVFQEELGYLEGGSKTLLDALEREILNLRGRIYLRCGVDQIVMESNKLKGIIAGGKHHSYDRVVSTIPLPYIPRLAPNLPQDLCAQINAIANLGVACVIIKLNKPLTDKFWLNINDPEIEIPGLIEYSNLNRMKPAIVYAPYYLPQAHPKYRMAEKSMIDEVVGYFGRINPSFRPDWIIAARVSRYGFAQTVCPPEFYEMLPPMRTPVDGFYLADTSYYYPEDRSISESIKVGKQLARLVN